MTDVAPPSAPLRPFTNGMRSPVVAPLTRFLIGVPVVLLPTTTDRFFAWTIAPPLTAAFLGANYWSGAWLAVLASRETLWATGRVSVSVALVFAPLTTAATFMHLDKFHLDTVYGWVWVVAYGIYPPMLAVLLARQLRVPGGDPPRTRPLPLWVKAILGVHAAVMVPLGVALFVAPNPVGEVWPWMLTPLTARVTAAWLLAFGVLAAHAIWENDLSRVKVALLSYLVFAALQVVALARFGDEVRWGEAGAYLFAALVASSLVLGSYGWFALRRRVEDDGHAG